MVHVTTSETPPRPALERAEERAFVADLYATEAEAYDRHLLIDCEYRTPAVLADALAPTLAKLAALGRGAWLDLGAGTGLLGRALAARGLVVPWVGLDLAPEMLARADAALYPLRCAVDVSTAIPVRDCCCSAVVAAGLLEHLADPVRLVREAYRVLVPGGALALSFSPSAAGCTEEFEPFSRLLAHAEDQLCHDVESAGFAMASRLDFDGYRTGREGWVPQCGFLAVARGKQDATAAIARAPVPTEWARILQCPMCHGRDEGLAHATSEGADAWTCGACHGCFPMRGAVLDLR